MELPSRKMVWHLPTKNGNWKEPFTVFMQVQISRRQMAPSSIKRCACQGSIWLRRWRKRYVKESLSWHLHCNRDEGSKVIMYARRVQDGWACVCRPDRRSADWQCHLFKWTPEGSSPVKNGQKRPKIRSPEASAGYATERYQSWW